MKSTYNIDAEEASNHAKRKRSLPSKLKIVQDGDGKRPRGRPPIPASHSNAGHIEKESVETSDFGAKQVKLGPSVIVQKIIAALMIDTHLSALVLSQLLPDATTETIQSILDILQVIGTVIVNMDKATSTLVYSLCGFAKGRAAVKFEDLTSVTTIKLNRASAIHERLASLQLLCDESISQDELAAKLRETVRKFDLVSSGDDKDALFSAILA